MKNIFFLGFVIILLPTTYLSAQKIETKEISISDYGEFLNKKFEASFNITDIIPFNNPTFYKYDYNYRSNGNIFMIRNPEYKYKFSFPNYYDSFNPNNAKNIQEALAFGVLSKLFDKIHNRNTRK